MLDFDAGKLLIIGVVALVVIGPKDLPRVLRQVGQWVGKLRRMAHEFQGQFMEAVKEADLQDLREEVAKLQDTASIDVHFDPARDIQTELTKAVETPAAVAAPAPVEAPATLAEPAAFATIALPPHVEPMVGANAAAAGIAPVADLEPPGLPPAIAKPDPAGTEALAVADQDASPSAHVSAASNPSVSDASPAPVPDVKPQVRAVPRRRPPARRIEALGREPAGFRSRMLPPVRRETPDP